MGSSTTSSQVNQQCQFQQQSLQAVYTKAYIELTRLVAEYESSLHSSTCQDYVIQTSGSKEKVFQEKIEHLTATITQFSIKLESFRVRIEEAYRAENHLRIQITQLTQRCSEM